MISLPLYFSELILLALLRVLLLLLRTNVMRSDGAAACA